MNQQTRIEGGSSRTRLTFAATLMGLMMGGLLFARWTGAQAPGGQGQQPGATGRQGRGGRGAGGFGQGGPGGFGGRMPSMSGTITGGDRAAGTITITSPFGGGAQTLKVSPTTKYAAQTTIDAGALRVGDEIQVQGVPTGITASSITAGQMPDFLRPGGNNGRGRNGAGAPGNAGGQTDPNAAGGNGAGQDPALAPPQAFASATGRVIATSPLTIALSNNVSITLKTSAETQVTKISTATFDSLKVGDIILATGQADASGTFTATGVGINLNQGGFGQGRRGGFGGQGRGNPRGNAVTPPAAPNNASGGSN